MPRTSAKRLSLRALCISVATFTMVAVTAGVAWAAYTDNMYPTQNLTVGCFSISGPSGPGFCQTDNRDLTYYMDSGGSNKLEADDRADVNNVMNNVYEPDRPLGLLRLDPLVLRKRGDRHRLRGELGGMSASADGNTFCNSAATMLKCDQQYIRIRGGGHYTQGLVCHETGHAVGLTHGDDASPRKSKTDEKLGCMETPVSDDEGLASEQHREHQRHLLRRAMKNRTRIAAAAGIIAAASVTGVIVAALAAPAADHTAQSLEPQSDVLLGNGSDHLPSVTAADWVTYADHVIVVEAVSEEALQPTAAELERGEGVIGRIVSLTVEDVLWSREGAPKAAPATWEYSGLGWHFAEGDTAGAVEMALVDFPRVEVGHQYVMAIRWERALCEEDGEYTPAQWRGLGEGSEIPYDDNTSATVNPKAPCRTPRPSRPRTRTWSTRASRNSWPAKAPTRSSAL